MKLNYIIIFLLFYVPIPFLYSYESSEVLPKNISYSSFKMGQIEVFEKYQTNGDLYNIADHKSILLDGKTVSKFNPQVKSLIQYLNSISSLYNFGDQIHFGSLRFNAYPRLEYFVPVYAYGMTDFWTLGVAIPIFKYKLKLDIYQESASNVNEIKEQINNGSYSSDLESALEKLENLELKSELYKQLVQKEYKPLEDIEKTFIGDVNLVNKFAIYKTSDWGFALQERLNLPTGPEDDPDDLTDLVGFHQLGLESKLIQTYKISQKFNFGASFNYYYKAAKTQTQRVASHPNDQLPDASTKQKVKIDIGDEIGSGVFSNYHLNDFISFGCGVDFVTKFSDQINQRNVNNESSWNDLKLKTTYSTVKSVLKNIQKIPYEFSYMYSDRILGFNIEKFKIHQLEMAVYF